jgi:23S rRNA-/tRNA-specific pseudouridylate synthase
MSLLRTGTGSVGTSLLRLEPQTGRSHQLRVQCAKRGLPIVGDRTYGNFAANREFARASGIKRMFLHSVSVGLEYDFKGARHAFAAVAPLPPEFETPA